jgi:hypothetical protein
MMTQSHYRDNEEKLLYNISIGSRLPQTPPQSPHLNPTENVWNVTVYGNKKN